MKNNGKLGVAQEMLRDNFFKKKFMVRLIDKWDKSGLLRIIKVKISPPFGYPRLTERKEVPQCILQESGRTRPTNI